MSSNVRLWYHWVLANAFAEVVGLGLVGFIGWLMFGAIGERSTATLVLAFATFTVALGALEGTVVGWAQSLVIRKRICGFEGWVQATVVGALVAWFVGMIPSTAINLMPHDQAELSPSISQSIRMLLAVGLGFVTGPLLAVFQYRVLCRYVGRAGWWLLANALAWAVGMPVVFAGLHVAYMAVEPWVVGSVIIGTLALAGAAVGSIHGIFLVHLLRPENQLRFPLRCTKQPLATDEFKP